MALVAMQTHFVPLLNEWDAYLHDCHLRLFVNDWEPSPFDDFEDYDEPPSDVWYQPLPLIQWAPAYINADGKGEKDHEFVVWIWQPPVAVQIYGWFITDYLNYVLCAERDPKGPVYLTVPGQPYIVKPRLTLCNEPAAAALRKQRKKR